MSRSLKPTWPFSSRWIFHAHARMAAAASSRLRPRSVRNRRNRAPTSIRWTVGPPPLCALDSAMTVPRAGIATQSPTLTELSRRKSVTAAVTGTRTLCPMASWSEVEAAAPELAARARTAFDAHRHKVLATLRRDGSPRLSGIEAGFVDGELLLGMMPGSRKALDLRRDPRLALHSASVDPPDDPTTWPGDAKLAGRA